MTLTFENEQDFDLGFDPEEVAAAVINGVLDQEACPYEAEVELILTDPENIRTMNREHRNIDRETDVLSFPMVDYPSPASFDFLETDEGETVNVCEAHPDIVDELRTVLTEYIVTGRSTPGAPQENYPCENWPGLGWLQQAD